MPQDTVTVQSSNNYDQFNLIGANRVVNRGHVEAIKKAFEETGNFTKFQPILVNENYDIIDGQHRFTALQEMGLPVYYTMVEGLRVKEAREMNNLQLRWNPLDFAHSYAEGGNENYQKYLDLREDYGLSHSVTMAYIIGRGNDGGNDSMYSDFRTGDFIVSDIDEARQRLNKLAELGEFTNVITYRPFALAYLKIMQSPEFNQGRMTRKMRLFADRLVKRLGTIEDNLRMIEDVYNHNQSEDTQPRLYR